MIVLALYIYFHRIQETGGEEEGGRRRKRPPNPITKSQLEVQTKLQHVLHSTPYTRTKMSAFTPPDDGLAGLDAESAPLANEVVACAAGEEGKAGKEEGKDLSPQEGKEEQDASSPQDLLPPSPQTQEACGRMIASARRAKDGKEVFRLMKLRPHLPTEQEVLAAEQEGGRSSPLVLRTPSLQVAEMFEMFGTSREDARDAIDAAGGNMAAAGKALLSQVKGVLGSVGSVGSVLCGLRVGVESGAGCVEGLLASHQHGGETRRDNMVCVRERARVCACA